MYVFTISFKHTYNFLTSLELIVEIPVIQTFAAYNCFVDIVVDHTCITE